MGQTALLPFRRKGIKGFFGRFILVLLFFNCKYYVARGVLSYMTDMTQSYKLRKVCKRSLEYNLVRVVSKLSYIRNSYVTNALSQHDHYTRLLGQLRS
jgi:hypothetical protein